MGISWEDMIYNSEVLRRARSLGIEALIIKAQLRWVGHVVRMDDSRLPKMAFFSELSQGSRNQGGPVKRFKDSLKASLRNCGIPILGWEALAADRDAWRLAVHKGINKFEEARLGGLDLKRQLRKERRPDPSTAVTCPTCGRICASEFGLRSHLRRH